jgi:hypothetical protein
MCVQLIKKCLHPLWDSNTHCHVHLLSRHQSAGQNWDTEIANRLSENVSKLKKLGKTVANKNVIQEKIKRRLNFGNACYHSVNNLLSSRVLSKKT